MIVEFYGRAIGKGHGTQGHFVLGSTGKDIKKLLIQRITD